VYTTAGQWSTSVVDYYDQWHSDAAYRQSPVLSEEGHFVFIPRRMPISGTPLAVSTVRTLMYDVDEYLRSSLAENISSVACSVPATGMSRLGTNPVHDVVSIARDRVITQQTLPDIGTVMRL